MGLVCQLGQNIEKLIPKLCTTEYAVVRDSTAQMPNDRSKHFILQTVPAVCLTVTVVPEQPT